MPMLSGLLQQLESEYQLNRKLLHHAYIVGRKPRRGIVMSDPESAQRLAGAVIQRNDQVLDDRRSGPTSSK